MADYTRYKTETLKKMRDAAWEKYYSETMKPGDGWGAGFRHWKLREHKGYEKAKARYDAICAELKRREAAQTLPVTFPDGGDTSRRTAPALEIIEDGTDFPQLSLLFI